MCFRKVLKFLCFSAAAHFQTYPLITEHAALKSTLLLCPLRYLIIVAFIAYDSSKRRTSSLPPCGGSGFTLVFPSVILTRQLIRFVANYFITLRVNLREKLSKGFALCSGDPIPRIQYTEEEVQTWYEGYGFVACSVNTETAYSFDCSFFMDLWTLFRIVAISCDFFKMPFYFLKINLNLFFAQGKSVQGADFIIPIARMQNPCNELASTLLKLRLQPGNSSTSMIYV